MITAGIFPRLHNLPLLSPTWLNGLDCIRTCSWPWFLLILGKTCRGVFIWTEIIISLFLCPSRGIPTRRTVGLLPCCKVSGKSQAHTVPTALPALLFCSSAVNTCVDVCSGSRSAYLLDCCDCFFAPLCRDNKAQWVGFLYFIFAGKPIIFPHCWSCAFESGGDKLGVVSDYT